MGLVSSDDNTCSSSASQDPVPARMIRYIVSGFSFDICMALLSQVSNQWQKYRTGTSTNPTAHLFAQRVGT